MGKDRYYPWVELLEIDHLDAFIGAFIISSTFDMFKPRSESFFALLLDWCCKLPT